MWADRAHALTVEDPSTKCLWKGLQSIMQDYEECLLSWASPRGSWIPLCNGWEAEEGDGLVILSSRRIRSPNIRFFAKQAVGRASCPLGITSIASCARNAGNERSAFGSVIARVAPVPAQQGMSVLPFFLRHREPLLRSDLVLIPSYRAACAPDLCPM